MNSPVPVPPRRCRPLVLIGFMGSGKSTVGRHVAAKMSVDFADADVAIERRAGRTIPAIFTADGEPAFRELEHDVVMTLLEAQRSRPQETSGVISLGGGAAMHSGTRQALQTGAFTVHLRVSLATAISRVGHDSGRPMLASPDLAQIHAERTRSYDELADLSIDTDDLTPDAVTDLVLAALRDRDDRGPASEGPVE